MNIEVSTYYELFHLLQTQPMLKFIKNVHRMNVNRLRKNKKIKIAFQVTSLSSWCTDFMPRLLSVIERFDVTIVITWQRNTVYEQEIPPEIEYFKNSGLKYCIADGSVHPGDFDIVFYLSPYLDNLANWTDKEIPLTTLLCYLPYGYCVESLQPLVFNLFLHNVAWKNYVPNKTYLEMGNKWCKLGNYNMVSVGVPKLDALYTTQDLGKNAVWKMQHPKVKKIIYAPHHSINNLQCMSTFAKNWQWMLNYAKNHVDTTSWIFKPHPLLIKSSVECGIFKNEQEYREYCKEWDSLPNGRYIEGSYLEYFLSSDCMIFDSMSFMAEYLFVDKPSLFLTREKLNLSELGEKIFPAHYSVSGNDYKGIQHFIEYDAIHDKKRTLRNLIFTKYLDYYKANGNISAAEKIVMDLLETFNVKM